MTDTPDLPFVDEYEALVEASASDVYAATACQMARSFEGPFARAHRILVRRMLATIARRATKPFSAVSPSVKA